jgi:type I restriction enzyme S subunit
MGGPSTVATGFPHAPLGDVVQNFDSTRVPLSSRERAKRPGRFPYYGATGIMDYVDDYLFEGLHLLLAEDGSIETEDGHPVLQLVDGRFWVNNHAHVLRATTDVDTRYLYYALSTVMIRPYMTGSVQAKLSQGNMNRIPVPFPEDATTREAIVHILGSLDDKIKLNRRMNETLEQMAQAMFKSWFVDFDPARAKAEGRKPVGLDAATAALFPDSFQDSPLGPIPRGWKIGKLSDLCSTQYGYTTSATDEPVGPKFLRVTDINKKNWIEWNTVPHCVIAEEDRGKYALSVGDIVVARMADPGKSAIIEDRIDAVFASYLVRLKTESLAQAYFVYGFLKSQAYREYSEGAMSGSVQANMNAKVIVGADLVVPPKPIVEAFLAKVLPLRHRMVANLNESSTLAAIRDALLPKLLSGEIRIKDAEKFVGEAM